VCVCVCVLAWRKASVKRIDSHHKCPSPNAVSLIFDLKNIFDRFIHKDSSRDGIFRFSHGGKCLVVRVERGLWVCTRHL
jgi:hypothetical protein